MSQGENQQHFPHTDLTQLWPFCMNRITEPFKALFWVVEVHILTLGRHQAIACQDFQRIKGYLTLTAWIKNQSIGVSYGALNDLFLNSEYIAAGPFAGL